MNNTSNLLLRKGNTMKKLLSLLIVAVMLLSTLTACDLETAKGYLVNVLEQFTTTAKEDKVVRTTVTEEEYVNAFKVNNFTVKAGTGEEGVYMVVDGSKIIYQISMGESGISIKCDLEKHVIISSTSTGDLAYFSEDVASEGEVTLENVGLLESYAYETLTYNEERKSYTYSDEDEILEFFFEDGALAKVVMSNPNDTAVQGEVYDVGTSVVELGEYIVVNDGKVDPSKAAADVVTIVTDEQLVAHLELRNFTINAVALQYGLYSVEASLKVADTALELAINMMGEKEAQYMALVDGEFLSIERLGDGYLATPIGATMEDL
jgi:uncharacterized lipoprotein YehR (DUF1307 family)